MAVKQLVKPAQLPNDLIGVAGVHYVAYKLSLRGLIVLPTIRNTAGIDLLVHDPKTNGQASLQVKTTLTKASFWPTSKAAKCLRGPGAFHVFLRWLPAEERFEEFLENGDLVAERILQNADDYVKRGNKEFAFWQLPKGETGRDALRDAWRNWAPPTPAVVARQTGSECAS